MIQSAVRLESIYGAVGNVWRPTRNSSGVPWFYELDLSALKDMKLVGTARPGTII
jgi:hypothetical protein